MTLQQDEIQALRRRIERLSRSIEGDAGPLQDLLHLMLNRIEALELGSYFTTTVTGTPLPSQPPTP